MNTYNGAKSETLSTEQQLRRSVLSCLLWEDTFYEDGISIADRISKLSADVEPSVVASLAVEARSKFKLRSVPLLLALSLAKNGKEYVRKTLSTIIQRPDEITKFMDLYWKNGKTPIAKQVKLGLADAFPKFNEYQLAKWNRGGKTTLRDVMFLTHPKPLDENMWHLWKKLADDTLSTPDTWEVGLSAAKSQAEKKAVWERLLSTNKLGALALIKNLRNMVNVAVSSDLIKSAIESMKVERVLPYRFVTANKFAPNFSTSLEQAMFRCLEGSEKINGKTVLLVDVSGSMDAELEPKPGSYYNTNTWSNNNTGTTSRIDVANGLAILLKNMCEDVSIYSFSHETVKIPDVNGFKLGKAILNSQSHGGTYLGKAVDTVVKKETFDRIIVITDEQSNDNIQSKIKGQGYIMNVAPYGHAIDHDENWTRINGFSEACISFIMEYEKASSNGWLPSDLFEIKWE